MPVSVSVLVDTQFKKEESLKLVGVPGFFVKLLARFVRSFISNGNETRSSAPSSRRGQRSSALHLDYSNPAQFPNKKPHPFGWVASRFCC
jgi:hypothetical protein